MALAVCVVDVAAHLQVLVDLGGDVGTSGETLVVGVDDDTVDVSITERNVILCLIVATIHGNAVLLTKSGTSHLILPVNGLALAIKP